MTIFLKSSTLYKNHIVKKKKQPIWDEGVNFGALKKSIKSELVKEIYNTSKRDLRSKKKHKNVFLFFF